MKMQNTVTSAMNNFEKKHLLLLPLILMICFLKISVFNSINNDMWFLLNHGRYVLQHGFPYIEPFTIHVGFKFVMQQWLSAVILWAVYSASGIVGINVLVASFYAFTMVLVYKLCLKISTDNFQVSFFFTCIISLLLFDFMVARPYIFSILIFVVELYCLESYILTKYKRYLFALPFLSILLINIHSSMWPMLIVLAIPYLIDSLEFHIGNFAGQGYWDKTFLLMIFTMIPMGLINPYGIGAMTYLFNSYGINEINFVVREMRPLDINLAFGKIIFASFIFVVFIRIINQKVKVHLRYILLALGTAYLTFSSIRGFAFFAVCGFFPLAFVLKDFQLPKKPILSVDKTLRLRKVLVAALILSCSLLVFSLNKATEPEVTESTLLSNTIEFVKKNDDISKIKMYTGYNDGGLVEFNGIPAYLDSRAEIFVKKNNMVDDVFKEYYQLQIGTLYYQDFLEKYQFTHLIVTKTDSMYADLIHDNDYLIAYSNKKYTLFEKKNEATLASSTPYKNIYYFIGNFEYNISNHYQLKRRQPNDYSNPNLF